MFHFCATVNFHRYYNSVIETNMVSTRKKRQSNNRLISQLDDFDQDMIIGSTASERQENVVVDESTNVHDFTIGTSNVSPVINKNAMNVKTLERCFKERIDREMKILLIRLKIGYRMQFWPPLITSLLQKSN